MRNGLTFLCLLCFLFLEPVAGEEERERQAHRRGGILIGGAGGALVTKRERELGRPIRNIVVVRHNVFDPDDAPNPFFRFLYEVANTIHITTRDPVVRREALLEPGDRYDADLAHETERVLRSFPFIAEARVYPEETNPVDPDAPVDLVLETRDKWSLRVGLGASFVAGEGSGNFRIGDGNFLGFGKDIELSAAVDEQGFEYGVAYEDPRLLGTEHFLRATVDIGEDEDAGTSQLYAIEVGRPFLRLSDQVAYSAGFQRADGGQIYVGRGETIAVVTNKSTTGVLSGALATPGRKLKGRAQVDFLYQRNRFDTTSAFENQVDVRVPPSFESYGASLAVGFDWHPRWVTRRAIDTLDRTEDIPTGLSVTLQGGIAGWTGRLNGYRFPVGASVRMAAFPWEDLLVTGGAVGTGRVRAGRFESHSFKGYLHAYYLALPFQTLAAAADFESQEEEQLLQTQITLGENSGLRGYERDIFDGTKRLRFHLEDRIRTPIEILSVHLGLVFFLDAGFAWDRFDAVGLDDLRWSAGFGFRLGSSELFGRGVARLDVAFPLNDDAGEAPGVSVSVTTGQVFRIFERIQQLAREF